MLPKLIEFIKEHLDDIILVIGVILISLLSFAMGYIMAKQQEKTPLIFEEETTYENSNNWSGNQWIVFSLEAFQNRS